MVKKNLELHNLENFEKNKYKFYIFLGIVGLILFV